ncbi:MAG: hypothetical protein CVT96_08925 [Bacteroidetes bacterium HGW-Bacteroidetes-13]|jgi:hypothetical protein|nr:MAG: hypothetical protein CVT96_08925 [Bacteroidetes bacterium HGW-Bacteroidetes-13]
MCFLRYFWFWIRANNRHGVHSPFVYALMENAVFDKKSVHSAKEILLANNKFREFSYFDRKRIRLFLKLINFFMPKQLVWIGERHQNLFNLLNEINEDCQFIQLKIDEQSSFINSLKTIDWLIVDAKSIHLELFNQIKNKLSNDSKIFVLESDNEFFRLRNEWGSKVELDFFIMKILLFRIEMKPQNFRLRS